MSDHFKLLCAAAFLCGAMALPALRAAEAEEKSITSIEDAINALRDKSRVDEWAEARGFLTAQGEKALPALEKVLKEPVTVVRRGDVLPRLHVAMVQETLAGAVPKAKIEPLLSLCLSDKDRSVAYYGLRGLLKLQLSSGELRAMLEKALGPERSIQMGVLAAEAAAENKITQLVPWVYRLIYRVSERLPGVIGRLKRTMMRRGGMQMGGDEEMDDLEADMEMEPLGARAGWGGRYGRRAGPMEPVDRGDGRGGVRMMEFNPDLATRDVARVFAKEVDRQPYVTLLRRAGLALEKLTGENFRFSEAPGWQLTGDADSPASKAAIWFGKNSHNYPKLEITPTVAEKPSRRTRRSRTGRRGDREFQRGVPRRGTGYRTAPRVPQRGRRE